MPLDVGVRQVVEEVLEVLERVQAVGLGSLDDVIDGSAGLGSFRGVAEQPILAADGEVADGALADVVGTYHLRGACRAAGSLSHPRAGP